MDNLVISSDYLKRIIEYLIRKMRVYGPTSCHNNFAFSLISSFDKVVFDYTYTILPPKKLLFPQKETLFTFNLEKIENTEPYIDSESQCILGVHPCDINGISLLDRVFSSDSEDPYYLSRREKTIIIGMDCMPDHECFCTSLNTDTAVSGFDLFLTPVNDRFVINVGSKKGEKLIRQLGEAQMASSEDMDGVRKYRNKKRAIMCKGIDADYRSLPLFYAGAFNLDTIWNKHADRCFECCSCIFVCPTCYCFNVEDYMDISLKTGSRQRIWDGCMLSGFAEVASGENFRKSKADRLKHRFNRKFQFHMVKYGKLFCVGCGRCGRVCLAEIKPVEVTNEIIEAKGNEQKIVYSQTGEID